MLIEPSRYPATALRIYDRAGGMTQIPFKYILGSTAQLRPRASADLFRQFCGLKNLKYIQYSCVFQTLP